MPGQFLRDGKRQLTGKLLRPLDGPEAAKTGH